MCLLAWIINNRLPKFLFHLKLQGLYVFIGLSLLHKPLGMVKEDTGVHVQRHKLCDCDPISVIDTISHFRIQLTSLFQVYGTTL